MAENKDFKHSGEVSVALFLVEICSSLTKSCQELTNKTKVDKSPVTQADLAVQALVTLYLRVLDADMKLIAEEDDTLFQEDANPALLESVTQLVNKFFPFETISETGKTEFSPDEVLEALRGGNADPSKDQVCWILDPIDGTRGFVNGEQYAVCLGKIVDGELVVSVVSCPNIPEGEYCKLCILNEQDNFYAPPKANSSQKDCWMVAAVKGQGCRQIRFKFGQTETTWDSMTPCKVSSQASMFEFRFCESINYPPENQGKVARVSASVDNPTYRLDGMAKYALVATGQMEAYLRFSGVNKQKAWDHIGELLVQEAGGEVSDIRGIHLNFTTGRFLSLNTQLVASNKVCHEDLLEVSRTVCGVKKL